MTNKTTKIKFQIKYDSPSYVLRYKLLGRSRYKLLDKSIEAPKERNTEAKGCRTKYHNKRQFYY